MAEKKQEIKAVFSVVADQASKVLKELRNNFKVTESALKDFTENATSLGALTFTPLAGVMGSLGATVADSLNSFVDYSTGVGDLAAKIGASAQDLQRFQYAAQMSGSSAEEISGAIEILGKNLGQVSSGKNKAIPEMFKQLGVSLYNSNGELKTATELLPDIANCIRSQSTAMQKSYIATTLFGKSGQGLIQMLEGGAEGLNELTAEAENFGVVLSDEVLSIAGDYDDSLNKMQYSLRGVQYSIASQVLPVLTPLVESITECISANREWIASSIADVAKDVASAIEKIDFKACIMGAVEFAKNAYELFTNLGGLKAVAIAVGAVFAANFAASLIGTISSIAGVVKALWGLNAVLFANPVVLIAGAIIAAIAGLIYVGYQLYENWDTVWAYIQELWSGVSAWFQPQIDLFVGLWDGIKQLPALVSTGFFALVDNLKQIWGGVVAWFQPQIDLFVGLWDGIKQLPELVSTGFFALVDNMKQIWESIKAVFFEPFMQAYNTLTKGLSSIKDFGSGMWDKVTGFFSSDDNKSAPAPLTAETLSASSGGKMEGTMTVQIKTDPGTTAEVVNNQTSNNLKTNVNTGVMRGSYVPV